MFTIDYIITMLDFIVALIFIISFIYEKYFKKQSMKYVRLKCGENFVVNNIVFSDKTFDIEPGVVVNYPVDVRFLNSKHTLGLASNNKNIAILNNVMVHPKELELQLFNYTRDVITVNKCDILCTMFCISTDEIKFQEV